jgi:pilus assembly protein CpaB
MENKRAIVISIICFVISMFLISGYVTLKEKELTADFGNQVEVVIADGEYFKRNNTDQIPEYSVLQADMLKTIKVFKNFQQPMTVTDVKDVIGKATYVSIHEGEQITLTKLVSQDGKPVLDRQVERKMRAVTIMISPASGVGKLIRPGNRVDVLVSPVYDSGGSSIAEIKTLFQNVTVLATGKHIQNEVPTRVDRELLTTIEEVNNKSVKRKDIFGNTSEGLSTSRPDDNYQTVTLQLSTDDAEKLLFLTHKYGDKVVYLTLRNTVDPSTERLATTLLDDVLGPESDYGKSKRKIPSNYTPAPPKYNDLIGSEVKPKY